MTLFLLLARIVRVHGWGDGPIGLYAIDSQTALVCDSDRDAIFLVDIRTGGAIATVSMAAYWDARMTFNPQTRTGDTPHLVGIASCSSCLYFLATFHTMHFEQGEKTTTSERILRFELKNPLADWRDGNVGLEHATIVEWTLPPKQGVRVRMITLDETGTLAYVANFNGAVLSFDPLFSPGYIGAGGASPQLTEVATLHKARSVQLTGIPGEILAAGEADVAFINVTTGETCTVGHGLLACRDAVMDPTRLCPSGSTANPAVR